MIGSRLASRFIASPNVERRQGCDAPDMIILHYTGMESAERACDWLCDPQSKVSCHYLIDGEGGTIQMVDERLRAWHAGASSWKSRTDINSCSIGIEIHNPGHAGGYPDFSDVQMQAVTSLCRDILSRHAIPPSHVLAHSDIAPQRKIDPGEKFDWKRLWEAGIGHWVVPEPIQGNSFLQQGDQGQAVKALQSMLRLYGYGVEMSGDFDAALDNTVKAFQRHFRQEKVNGVADQSTVATLRRLLLGVP